MAVYRILTKKRVRSSGTRVYTWTNTYTIVSATPFSRDEAALVADTVAPRLVEFERHFHIEDVEFFETQTVPVLDPPQTNIFAARFIDAQGIRPIAATNSAGPAFSLWIGFEPLRNHWGKKDYCYSLGKDEYMSKGRQYSMQASTQAQLQKTLMTAKHVIQPLLQADPKTFCLAVSADKDEHLPESYGYRFLTNVVLRGLHVVKHTRH